jgi:hypothetical protein
VKGERTGELVGQDAGKALLMIEARIGQLLPPPKEALKTALAGGMRQKRLYGMDDSQAKRSRAIASHPAEVDEVYKEAEENEDIPTKTALSHARASCEFGLKPIRPNRPFSPLSRAREGRLKSSFRAEDFGCGPLTHAREGRLR